MCSVIYINWSWLNSTFFKCLSLFFKTLSMLLISLYQFYFLLTAFCVWYLSLILYHLLIYLSLLVLYVYLFSKTMWIWRLKRGAHCVYTIELLLQKVLLSRLLCIFCWIWKYLLLILNSWCRSDWCTNLNLTRNIILICIYDSSWFWNQLILNSLILLCWNI